MAPDRGPDPDLTIVLLGNSGVGKSASGNTILGRKAFESKQSFAPVTKQICEKRGNVFGKQISVVDTPGIFGSEMVIQSYCQELLQSSRPCLFLIVVKIDRFTIEQENAVDAAMRVIGDDGLNKCYLLFTHGDYLDNMTLDGFINGFSGSPLKPLAGKFAGRLHLFNNKNGGQEQVRELLKKSGHLREDPDLTIVLVGNSGVGKSASGNTILGREAFESKRSFAPVTKQICEKTGNVFGKQISVVDTPGIFGSEDVIQTCCQELLQSSRPCLFLIVVKIDRFNIEQKNAVDAAIRVIGDDGLNKCYLLFTHGHLLHDTTLDEFINDDPDGPLKPLAEKFAGRLHVFNNKNGGQEQVRELLKKSGHLREVAQPMTSRRIVLLGLPGKGKSASGNTILGSNQFKLPGSFNSVTAKTVSASATVEGRQVTVVDTPGFTDEVLTPRQLYREILGAVVEAKPGPHAFVFVISIDRVMEPDIKLFELLPKLFDSDVCKACEYSMVLFTHGDKIEKGKSIDDMIKENKNVSDLVSMCGGRYCVFENKDKGNREQVRNLLGKIDEMVEANRGEHFTNVKFRMDRTVLRMDRTVLRMDMRENDDARSCLVQ